MEKTAASQFLIKKLENYEVLGAVADGFAPDPKNSVALVAENGTEIVGRVFLMSICHIEGTWVKEEFRNGFVGARLFRRVQDEARKLGITKLFAYTDNDKNGDYMERMGFRKQPLTVWMKGI